MVETKHINGDESVDELFRDESEEPMGKTPREVVEVAKDSEREVNEDELLYTDDE